MDGPGGRHFREKVRIVANGKLPTVRIVATNDRVLASDRREAASVDIRGLWLPAPLRARPVLTRRV